MAASSPTEKHILVVDDSPEVSDSLTEILEGAGYRVAQACQGRQALSYLRNAPLPSVILLDLQMPVMSGREFRQAQQKDPRLKAIPVILLSDEGNLSVHAGELGVKAFLTKPVDRDLLLAHVRHCLDPEAGRAPEQPATTAAR